MSALGWMFTIAAVLAALAIAVALLLFSGVAAAYLLSVFSGYHVPLFVGVAIVLLILIVLK